MFLDPNPDPEVVKNVCFGSINTIQRLRIQSCCDIFESEFLPLSMASRELLNPSTAQRFSDWTISLRGLPACLIASTACSITY